jgi:predicted TIM-barrel fold metal-dependent hydrolase
MPTIDADAHVVESDATWGYMDPSEREFRPVLVRPSGEASREYWMVDGKIRGLARSVITSEQFAAMSARAGRRMDTPKETREMENVPARLRHMDELGIDVQVLYPTIFIEHVADRPEVETAICRSYNRWMAEIWDQGKGRLRWVAPLPLQTMDRALEQLAFAHENGACAVFMRGVEGNRLLHDPYFDPLFQEASDRNMAIGVHIANSNPQMCDLLSQRNGGGTFWKFRLANVGAFHSVVMSGLPDRFPKLRIVFAEAAAQWVPYVLKDLRRRWAAKGEELPDNPLAEYRLYVTLQNDDDIDYLLRYTGEENVIIGTDYGHNDQSTEVEALRNLRESGVLTAEQYDKITWHNPKTLYGL